MRTDLVISLRTTVKSREQVLWGPARLSQHGVTKHACYHTGIIFSVWERINQQPWYPQYKQNMSKCQNKLRKGRERQKKWFADKSQLSYHSATVQEAEK